MRKNDFHKEREEDPPFVQENVQEGDIYVEIHGVNDWQIFERQDGEWIGQKQAGGLLEVAEEIKDCQHYYHGVMFDGYYHKP